MDGEILLSRALSFDKELTAKKIAISDKFSWYPYGSLNNFIHLREIFNLWPLDRLSKHNSRILDIGAADGDLSFFLESLGYKLDILDNPPTNFNNLKGAHLLKEKLNSSVNIHEIDLDLQFKIPGDSTYDLVFFLGILYRLKNPFYILEALSKVSKYLILSTRIAQFAPDGTSISKLPLVYLLSPTEANNDSTNFWIFSEASLKRLFDRTNWNVLEFVTVGDKKASNPCDQDHDERAFVLLKSMHLK